MGREDPQLKLRLSEIMKEAVTASAKANGRSVNAEIVAMIEAAQDGGGAEASRWKEAFEEERAASSRAIGLVDQQMDMLRSYRDIVARASAEVQQHAGVVLVLCNLIETMDGPPADDTLEIVKRIKTGAELALAAHKVSENPSGDEEKSAYKTAMSKANKLLKTND